MMKLDAIIPILEMFLLTCCLIAPIFLIIIFVRRRNKFWFNYFALGGEILYFECLFFRIQHYPGQRVMAFAGCFLLIVAFIASLLALKHKKIPSTAKLGVTLCFYFYMILGQVYNVFYHYFNPYNSFQVVDSGLKLTDKNFDKINSILDSFDAPLKNNPSKVKPYYDRVMEAKKSSEHLVVYIDSLKALLISKTDGKNDAKENFDIPTRIMLNTAAAEDGSKGEAHKVKILLGQYRKQMLALEYKSSDSTTYKIGLLTPDVFNEGLNEKQNWEQYNFEEQPLASVIVTLTRLQNEIKNAETLVVRELLYSIPK